MKRLAKWLGIGIAAVIAAALVFVSSGYLLPSEIVIDIEQTLEAPPEALFPLFTTHDGVGEWWRQAALDMGDDFQMTHLGGPRQGAGMKLGFGATGEPVFERWTYTSATSPTRVEIDVDFQIFVSRRILTLTPEGRSGTTTRVRWLETAKVDNPIWRWMLKLNTESATENRHTVLAAAGTAAQHGSTAPPREQPPP